MVFKPGVDDEKPAATDSHLAEAIRFLLPESLPACLTLIVTSHNSDSAVPLFSLMVRGTPGLLEPTHMAFSYKKYLCCKSSPPISCHLPGIPIPLKRDPLKLVFLFFHFFAFLCYLAVLTSDLASIHSISFFFFLKFGQLDF